MPRLAITVLSFAAHVSSVARYLVGHASQTADDVAAAAELNWNRSACELPRGLELEWLGTSGFRIAYQDHQILIDPYLTRLPISAVLRRRVPRPSVAAIERHLTNNVSAILIGHTHFDHALDAPAIARMCGCPVYGSRSMASLMRLHALGAHAVVVDHYRVYEIGPFAITFVPSVHAKLVLGWRVNSPGDISCDHFDQLSAGAYRCGQVYGIHISVAGASFYHQGSADLIDEAVRHRGVDYFLGGIAGRRFSERYLERVLRTLQPGAIVPHHYDNFFRPLDRPMHFSFNVNFSSFVDELRAASREVPIVALRPLQTMVRGCSTP